MRLTDKTVRDIQPAGKGYDLHWDDELKGFACRVTAKGAKSFVLQYRVNGIERRLTLGRYPDWSVAAARRYASEVKRKIFRGEDPQATKTEARRAPTVSDLIERYEREHLPRKRPSSRAEDLGMIARHVRPALATRKVADITFADIDALHQRLARTPYRANRVLALLSKMFSMAIKWQWRPDNPCRGVERFQESKRKRYLASDEIEAVAAALDAYPDQTVANAFRLMLLTGCRKGEALGATWDQFDLKARTWAKPGSTTKQKTEHVVPLSAPAAKLLSGIKRKRGSQWVFPSRIGDQPIGAVTHAWHRIRATAGVPDVRIHDLRHTYASLLASSGQSLPVIGALLGHANPVTTARYAHLFDDPLRAATETVGAIVTGEQAADVVPLDKGVSSR